MDFELKWLEYAKELQSIAQAGLTYSKDKYDIERFEKIREISVEIVHNYTDIECKKVKKLFASETGYQTPKIDVRAAIFKGKQILLVKEKIDGLWAMPGGWADINCSLRENLIREAKEEAGASIAPKRIVAVLDMRRNNIAVLPYGIYKIFVECDYIKGRFKENIETSECRFFDKDNLPSLSKGRNTEQQIKMCFEAREKRIHEAIFD
ncbi:MAG: NUDIX hydrolase [Clostridia bacterium]|nr:NUDIX hydrolase [Clostridia bacterium]